EPTEGLGEQHRLVHLGRRFERGAAKLRRQRRRPVDVAAPDGEELRQMRGGVAVTAVFEHPCEKLVRGRLRPELRQLVLGGGQEQARLQLQERRDQDQELRRRVEIQL